jgi:hypothetical protein
VDKEQLKYNPFRLVALKMDKLKKIRLLVRRRSKKQNRAKTLPDRFTCIGKKKVRIISAVSGDSGVSG